MVLNKDSKATTALWQSNDPRVWQPHPKLLELARRKDTALRFDPDARLFRIWLVETLWRRLHIHIGATFTHCPFTGRMLPGMLVYERWRVLAREYGYAAREGMFDDGRLIPHAFRDDRWWRDRAISLRTGRERWWYTDRDQSDPRGLPWIEWSNPLYGHGQRRHPARPPHLCKGLSEQLSTEAARWMGYYVPKDRELGVRILDWSRGLHDQPVRIVPFDHCPYCGTRLPPSLRQERIRRLTALGLDPDDAMLPEIWHSDAWWREAGLAEPEDRDPPSDPMEPDMIALPGGFSATRFAPHQASKHYAPFGEKRIATRPRAPEGWPLPLPGQKAMVLEGSLSGDVTEDAMRLFASGAYGIDRALVRYGKNGGANDWPPTDILYQIDWHAPILRALNTRVGAPEGPLAVELFYNGWIHRLADGVWVLVLGEKRLRALARRAGGIAALRLLLNQHASRARARLDPALARRIATLYAPLESV